MPPTLAPRSASMLHAIEGGHGGGAQVNEWMNPEPVPKRSHNVHQPLRPGRSVLWSVQFISPRAGMRDLGVCVFGAFHPTVCIPPFFLYQEIMPALRLTLPLLLNPCTKSSMPRLAF